MELDEAKQFTRDFQRVQGLPPVQVENIKSASKEELAEMVIDLRLWCGVVYLELKDLRQQLAERNDHAAGNETF